MVWRWARDGPGKVLGQLAEWAKVKKRNCGVARDDVASDMWLVTCGFTVADASSDKIGLPTG